MKVVHKMILLVLASIVGLLALTMNSYIQMNSIYQEAQVVPSTIVPKIQALETVTERFDLLNRLIWEHVTTDEDEAMSKVEADIVDAHQRLTESLDSYEKTTTEEIDHALLAKDKAALAAFDTVGSSVLTLSLESKKDLARAALLNNKDKISDMMSALAEHRTYNFNKANTVTEAVLSIKDKAIDASLITTLLITLLVAGLSWYIATSLIKALGIEPALLNKVANGFAKGDFEQPISVKADDKSSVAYSIKKLGLTLKSVIDSMQYVSQKHEAGEINETVDHTRFSGGYAGMAQGINRMVQNHVSLNRRAMQVVKAFGEGNFNESLEQFPGDLVYINETIEQVRTNLTNLIADANLLSEAAVNGELKTRADESKHQGDFRKIISGVNATLDAVINPLNVAASYVDRIAKGDIPEKINDDYKGDFNAIKNNLNQCISAVNEMISDANLLSEAAVNGDLKTRADETKHQGDFRKIISGVNDTLDAVINPLNVAASYVDSIAKGDIPEKITDDYKGDFNGIKNNLNQCIKAIKLLLKDTEMLANAAEAGEVTKRADTSLHNGDYKKVIVGINSTLDMIVEPIITIKQAVDTIYTAANEISNGNSDLSSRTEKQATDLAKTASNMQELSKVVENNAQSSITANELATSAATYAQKGGEVVSDVVRTIQEINGSAKEIENIISVIDSIAFQTNILALNAAVEAARAGEQGKGFSVVAGEVRNLAKRSSIAAKEIKGLIIKSVNRTNSGTEQVENAGLTMQEIVNSVSQVKTIISEISESSQIQTKGISSVYESINSMDEVTQQNAALVEEAAAAAESLVEQANELTDAVRVFKADRNAFESTKEDLDSTELLQLKAS